MNSSRGTILAVAGDPGGANALAPVLRLLSAGQLRIVACPYREAGKLWTDYGITVTPIADSNPAEQLRTEDVSLLLTATSMNGLDCEKSYITVARSLGIPSVSVLDFWSHYCERFADSSGALLYVPDRIAVMDHAAREGLLRCGIAAERLVVTGQPAFDALFDCRHRFSSENYSRTRKSLDVAPQAVLVAFLSQPLSETVGVKYGYNELTVLQQLIAALADIQEKRATRLILLVRPHPRENPGKYRDFSQPGLDLRVSNSGDRREVAMAADLVVGMNTVLLFECCLLGCITVSLQPGLIGKDVLPSNHTGWSWPVYNAAQIEPTLERMLFDSNARADAAARLSAITLPSDATRNVVELILRTLRQGVCRP